MTNRQGLESAQFLVLLLDFSATSDVLRHAEWRPGPLPISYVDHTGKSVTTTGAARGTNFSSHLHRHLYDEKFRRHSTFEPQALGDLGLPLAELIAAEIIVLDWSDTTLSSDSIQGVVALHIAIDSTDSNDLASAVDVLSKARGSATSSPRGARLREWLVNAPIPIGHQASDQSPHWLATPLEQRSVDSNDTTHRSRISTYPIAFAVGDPVASNASEGVSESPVSASAHHREAFRNLEILSTLPSGQQTGEGRFRSDGSIIVDYDEVIQLSKDWSALIKVGGAAFVFHADTRKEFYPQSQTYFRTIYTDAFIIGRLQALIVGNLENCMHSARRELISERSGRLLLDRVNSVDEAGVILKSRYWLPVGDSVGQASKFILAYHDVAKTSAHFNLIEDTLAHFTRLAERRVSLANAEVERRTNGALNAIAYIGLPVSIVFAASEFVPGDPSWTRFVVVLLVAIATTAGIAHFLHRYTERT